MNNLVQKSLNVSVPDRMVAGRPISYFLDGTQTLTDGAASKLFMHWVAIKALLSRLEGLVVPEHTQTVLTLRHEMEDFRVNVSLVGQVKAGKTMLTNALVASPGLLPSDVNPWTSVVTSIHVNTPKPQNSAAVFSFYSQAEWENLTNEGGHLGEMAGRAGFDDELVEMRSQITEMQRRTEARLGANFGLLLGAQHRFSSFSTQVIDRYVCLGETEAPALGNGRYADVTKLAEIYIDDSSFGVPTTISDTPGVNDPFLARERATLETLSSADICIVVLSAHQSFSTVDLALMRILMAMQASQVILYVNRIDELENPDEQIHEIDGFIRGILKEKGITAEIPIIYGSAAWAETAVQGLTGTTADDTLDQLELFANDRLRRATRKPPDRQLFLGRPPYSTEKVRDLSGLKELRDLVSHNSILNVAAPFSSDILLRAQDIAHQSEVLMAQILEGDVPLRKGLDIGVVTTDLNNIMQDTFQDFDLAAQKMSEQMLLRISNTYREFIETESARIRSIIKDGRRISDWIPDTEQMRKSLNAAYHAFTAQGRKDVAQIYSEAAEQIATVYGYVLEDHAQMFDVRAPRVFDPKTPAALMRTMTLEMKTTWIGNWLAKASGGEKFINRFADTIIAEMNAFLAEMRDVQVANFIAEARRVLQDFMSGHMQTLKDLAQFDGDSKGGANRQKLTIEHEVGKRMAALKDLIAELQTLSRAISSDFELGHK